MGKSQKLLFRIVERDPAKAKAERDAAIERVKRNQQKRWRARYRKAARKFLLRAGRGDQFIGEDLRRYAIEVEDVGEPEHANAWGAMFRAFIQEALDADWVREVGLGATQDPVSHSTRTPRYEVLR